MFLLSYLFLLLPNFIPCNVLAEGPPDFNPAGCDFIASGRHFTYAIYASIFLTYKEAKERCSINHQAGRLAWMVGHLDAVLIEDILLYVGYINLNINFWIDGVSTDPSKSCEGVQCTWSVQQHEDIVVSYVPPNSKFIFQGLNVAGEKNATKLAPAIRLVAHTEMQKRSVRISEKADNLYGFICSFNKEHNAVCPVGYKPLGMGYVG